MRYAASSCRDLADTQFWIASKTIRDTGITIFYWFSVKNCVSQKIYTDFVRIFWGFTNLMKHDFLRYTGCFRNQKQCNSRPCCINKPIITLVFLVWSFSCQMSLTHTLWEESRGLTNYSSTLHCLVMYPTCFICLFTHTFTLKKNHLNQQATPKLLWLICFFINVLNIQF